MENVQKLVSDLTDYLNFFSDNKNKLFIESMSYEHRTLQQAFTVLCLKWLENCASDEYRHDLRNQASYTISKELIELFEQKTGVKNPSEFLPFI
jgi:hypothetical protein